MGPRAIGTLAGHLAASASGLRCAELLALRLDELDFHANTIVVEEASDQRTAGNFAECKNEAAYRPVLLADAEGRKVIESLEQFVALVRSPEKAPREES